MGFSMLQVLSNNLWCINLILDGEPPLREHLSLCLCRCIILITYHLALCHHICTLVWCSFPVIAPTHRHQHCLPMDLVTPDSMHGMRTSCRPRTRALLYLLNQGSPSDKSGLNLLTWFPIYAGSFWHGLRLIFPHFVIILREFLKFVSTLRPCNWLTNQNSGTKC